MIRSRYLAIEVLSGEMPQNFSVSAWRVNYEYVEEDSSFVSSDSMLNKVHELVRLGANPIMLSKVMLVANECCACLGLANVTRCMMHI